MAAVVLAAAIGYVAGRPGSTRSAGPAGRDQAAAGQHGAGDWRSGQKKRRPGRRADAGRGAGSQSREQEFRRVFVELRDCADFCEDDPFAGGLGRNHPAWTHLCVWAMNTPRSEFPGVMHRVADAMGGDINEPVAELLLQRWVRFDPDSALQWVASQRGEELGNEEKRMELQMFLVQEAVLHHPRWAVERLRELHARIATYNARKEGDADGLDPFGDGGVYVNYDPFFYRLARLPDAQRADLVKLAGRDVLSTQGMEGWIRGTMSTGGQDALVELYQQSVETGNTHGFSESFQRYATEDWSAAREFAEKHRAHAVDEVVWRHWPEGDAGNAVRWYLGRSTDRKDRSSRIAGVAGSMADLNERRKWIEHMAAEREPVELAMTNLAGVAVEAGEIGQAFALLPRLPEQERQALKLEIYDQHLDKGWLNVPGPGSLSILIPQKKHAAFARRHPEFRAYVLGTNRKALREFAGLVESVEADLQGVPVDSKRGQ